MSLPTQTFLWFYDFMIHASLSVRKLISTWALKCQIFLQEGQHLLQGRTRKSWWKLTYLVMFILRMISRWIPEELCLKAQDLYYALVTRRYMYNPLQNTFILLSIHLNLLVAVRWLEKLLTSCDSNFPCGMIINQI